MFADAVGRRHLAVLAVAVLVLLAGCGGNAGPDSTTTTTGTTTTAAPTTTSTTSAALVDLDGDTLRTNHVDSLRAAHSFTSDFRFVTANENGTVRIHDSIRQQGDLTRLRSNVTSRRGNQTTVRSTDRYATPNRTYQVRRLDVGGRTSRNYAVGSPPYENTSVTPVNFTRATFAGYLQSAALVRWHEAGTTTYRGATVTRYRATDPSQFRRFRNETGFAATGSSRVATVQQANATLLVDQDGTIRYYHVLVTGRTNGMVRASELRVDVNRVGETTVAKPDWVSTAIQRSG